MYYCWEKVVYLVESDDVLRRHQFSRLHRATNTTKTKTQQKMGVFKLYTSEKVLVCSTVVALVQKKTRTPVLIRSGSFRLVTRTISETSKATNSKSETATRAGLEKQAVARQSRVGPGTLSAATTWTPPTGRAAITTSNGGGNRVG